MDSQNNYFKLSKCRKLSMRRRTLDGVTAYYYTYFEPRGLNKHERRTAIDSFKHPCNKSERKTSDEMIVYAIGEFIQTHDINEFDVILGMPSSSGIVKQIINRLILDCGFTGKVNYKGFGKTRIRNVKLKQHIIDRESSIKTKEKVPKSFQYTRRLHYDKVSKSSLYPTRFRRYIQNLLYLNVSNTACLKNKKVLVIDDTFGEGLTICEGVRLLRPHTNNVVCFSVMKDLSS